MYLGEDKSSSHERLPKSLAGLTGMFIVSGVKSRSYWYGGEFHPSMLVYTSPQKVEEFCIPCEWDIEKIMELKGIVWVISLRERRSNPDRWRGSYIPRGTSVRLKPTQFLYTPHFDRKSRWGFSFGYEFDKKLTI